MGKLLYVLLCSTTLAAAEQSIEPPVETKLLARLSAAGVQIYVCKEEKGSAAWTLEAPQAWLFDTTGRQTGKHSAGPSWEFDDHAKLKAAVSTKTNSPDASAIPWLLLKVTESTGAGALSKTAYIQRRDTRGGVAPTAGCDASHLGERARMQYSAVYAFYE